MRVRRRERSNGLPGSPYLEEALQVAYYHCVLEMPLKDIAVLLGKSPATITRRLDEVRQAGWVRDHPEFHPPPEIWKELQSRMTCAEVETALRDHFGPGVLRRVSVLPSAIRGGAYRGQESGPEQAARAGLLAAQRLVEAMATGPHVVGINWGWSVRHCVTNLRPSRPNPDLRFVPLVGNLSLDESDPHFEEAIECSSNRLAQTAASSFGAPRAPRLSTPAYIPRRFASDRRGLKAIRDFIESDISYRRIFGGADESGDQTALIDQMDTLVTGLSSIDVDTLPTYRPNLITPDDVAALERAGVVGDLALHLLIEDAASDSADSEEQALVDSINDLIVGASPRNFIDIAERSRTENAQGPGVLVVSVGAWKARILTAAIRMRAVNELITDLETAQAIARHAGIQIADSIIPTGAKR